MACFSRLSGGKNVQFKLQKTSKQIVRSRSKNNMFIFVHCIPTYLLVLSTAETEINFMKHVYYFTGPLSHSYFVTVSYDVCSTCCTKMKERICPASSQKQNMFQEKQGTEWDRYCCAVAYVSILLLMNMKVVRYWQDATGYSPRTLSWMLGFNLFSWRLFKGKQSVYTL